MTWGQKWVLKVGIPVPLCYAVYLKDVYELKVTLGFSIIMSLAYWDF